MVKYNPINNLPWILQPKEVSFKIDASRSTICDFFQTTDFREKLSCSKLCFKLGTNDRNTYDILKVCFGKETTAIIIIPGVVSKLTNFMASVQDAAGLGDDSLSVLTDCT
jgi:hypothetical protein